MKAQISILAMTLALTGACASTPNYDLTMPKLEAWTQFEDSDDQAVVLDWWTVLDDPALNHLVERAMRRNTDLRAADANLRAAQAMTAEVRTATNPTGQVGTGIARTRVAGLSQPAIPGTPERFATQTLANIGGALSWELDLFGRLAANAEAAQAETDEARWLRRQAEAGLAAALVRAWADYRYATAIEDRLQERAAIQRQILNAVQAAEALGGASRYDVEGASATLDQALADLPNVGAARRNAARRIAVLSGDAPSDTFTDGPLSAAPDSLAAGDPADMLRRRPDVSAAERRFAAAAAQARVAVADLYPRISLGGEGGVTADPGRLADAGAGRFSLGPTLTWGLFDMPRLRQRVIAADAQSEAMLARWEGVVLAALEEADGALDVWRANKQAAASAGRAARAADDRQKLVATREREGMVSRLTRLQADADALNSQIAALEARSGEIQAWISAQTALGAGWRDVATDARPKVGRTAS
ncbi:efflux transporter outer membrane subunit [Brevundimonas diminuta]|uniref:efflux transporter outer membrane subunit n=1 Tax=Brevundimonas diminuta TaxID=293 RepID=UPI003D9A6202